MGQQCVSVCISYSLGIGCVTARRMGHGLAPGLITRRIRAAFTWLPGFVLPVKLVSAVLHPSEDYYMQRQGNHVIACISVT